MDKNKNMNKDFFIKVLIPTFFVISCSLVIYVLSLPYEITLGLYSWLGNFILLYGIVTFRKIKGTHINPYSLFFLSYYFFSYGQIFLFSIGIEYDRFNLIRIYPQQDVLSYCLFFCIGTCFMLIGAFVAIKKDNTILQNVKLDLKSDDIILRNAVKLVAWIMFLLSTPVYLKQLISSLNKSFKHGYGAIYEVNNSTSVTNLIDSLSLWFITSVILLLFIYRSNKIFRTVLMLFLISIIISLFITGTRSGAMALLFSLIYIWNAEVRKFTKKDNAIIFMLLILVFSLLPVIQIFRGSEHKTIEDFVEIFKMLYKDNLFVGLIGELGGSMQPWLMTYDLIPESYSFKIGQSYIASLLTIIPSILLGGNSFTEYAHLSGWLMEVKNMSYGPGYSILAEAYYNFSWFGTLFMFFIGWFIFKLLSNNMLVGNILIYKNAFSAIALYLFITMARSSIYLGVRSEVYSIILPIIAIIIIYNTLKKRQHIKRY